MLELDDALAAIHNTLQAEGVDGVENVRRDAEELHERLVDVYRHGGRLPVAADFLPIFVFAAAASGVIGNLTYDLVKILWRQAVRSCKRPGELSAIEEFSKMVVRERCQKLQWFVPPAETLRSRVRRDVDGTTRACQVDVTGPFGLHAVVSIPWTDPTGVQITMRSVSIRAMSRDLQLKALDDALRSSLTEPMIMDAIKHADILVYIVPEERTVQPVADPLEEAARRLGFASGERPSGHTEPSGGREP